MGGREMPSLLKDSECYADRKYIGEGRNWKLKNNPELVLTECLSTNVTSPGSSLKSRLL
jgi:hypothetical protein